MTVKEMTVELSGQERQREEEEEEAALSCRVPKKGETGGQGRWLGVNAPADKANNLNWIPRFDVVEGRTDPTRHFLTSTGVLWVAQCSTPHPPLHQKQTNNVFRKTRSYRKQMQCRENSFSDAGRHAPWSTSLFPLAEYTKLDVE